MNKLNNKKVAILVADGFEESEFTEPKKAVEEAGALAHVVSLESGTIKSWDKTDWGSDFKVDKTINEVSAADYDGLILPGGVINPDKLRRNEKAVAFVKEFMQSEKAVAAICHGPWLLAEADVLKGRKLTSFFSIKTDLKNAGATWLDQEVVMDINLTTSRNPDDLPVFCEKLVEKLAES